MTTYLIKRILHTIPVIFGVIVFTFILMYVVPGDPVLSMVGERYDEATIQRLRDNLHLDDPLWKQFGNYVGNLLKGDLGNSFITMRPVANDLMDKFPFTLLLASSAMIVSIVVGLAVGIISSLKPNSLLDRGTMLLALTGISAPVFWVGLLLILIVGVNLKWLPPTGYGGVEMYSVEGQIGRASCRERV